MKLMKVFDCQDMPDNVRKEFFGAYDDKGNDCYVDWYLDCEVSTLVDDWVIENGATMDEHVIIRHWW